MERSERTIYEFSAPLFDGRLVALEECRAQALLIVNTASHCGFTPQYTGIADPRRHETCARHGHPLTR